MKTLTPKSAKLIAQKYFDRCKEETECEFVSLHTRAMVEIGVILAKKFGADASSVEKCAWVHDIGYVVDQSDHATHSLDLVKKEGFEVDTLIEDCILNHGTGGNPKSEEAKILQMADKISILNLSILKFLLEQRNLSSDDVDFLDKTMTGAAIYLKKLAKC